MYHVLLIFRAIFETPSNFLGTLQYFRKTFVKPISESRNQDCSEYEREYGEEKSEELGNMTKMFMLRRTQDVINKYLPPKSR